MKHGATLPTTTTRMGWLYDTLSHYGEGFEYGSSSRAWLVDRLAVADFSSRRDHALSTWWEDMENKSGAAKPKAIIHTVSNSISTSPQREPPDLTLTQVLANSSYRADFENFLEENLAGPALPFREAVQEWQDKFKTAHVWDPKGLDRLKAEAVGIYQLYLAPTATEKLDMDKKVLTHVKKALQIELQPPPLLRSPSEPSEELDLLTVHQLLERAEEYADHILARKVLDTLQVIPQEDQEGLCERAFAILTDKVKPKVRAQDPDDDGVPVPFSSAVFSDALKQVVQTLETLFVDFKQTDDYCDMFEPEPAPRTPALDPLDESDDTDVLSAEGGETERVRCPPWYNTEGWRSMRCEILDLHTKLSNVRAIINVDSTTYRTTLSDRDFRAGVIAEFALTSTTQYLSIHLRSGNRLAGILDLSMAAISQLAQGAEIMYPVRQVSKSQNLAKMELKLKIVCRKEEASPCALYQVTEDGRKGGFKTSLARGLVSKKKRRFQQDGFDLDLSYVTDQLIAMGYPSSGAEGVYRNPLDSVQRFFTLRHPQAYMLFNLCSERQYDVSKFQGRVRSYPCDDHSPPPFLMMKRFCEDVRLFLAEHPQNAASIHCKAGKGRTGTMIAAYLCYAGMEPSSTAALSTFAQSRTKNGKGVTIPSQARYVHYFDKYCRLKRTGKRLPGKTTLVLQNVYLHDALLQSNSTIVFSVTQRSEDMTVLAQPYNNEDRPIWKKSSRSLKWDMHKYTLALNDDVLFEFFEKTISGSKVKLFQFWFNTRMCEMKFSDRPEDPEPRLIFEKHELDKAVKDTKHKGYSPDFRVELVFALTCLSGIVKSHELNEKVDDPLPLSRPSSPSRKLPPPLPASYSFRKVIDRANDDSVRHSQPVAPICNPPDAVSPELTFTPAPIAINEPPSPSGSRERSLIHNPPEPVRNRSMPTSELIPPSNVNILLEAPTTASPDELPLEQAIVPPPSPQHPPPDLDEIEPFPEVPETTSFPIKTPPPPPKLPSSLPTEFQLEIPGHLPAAQPASQVVEPGCIVTDKGSLEASKFLEANKLEVGDPITTLSVQEDKPSETKKSVDAAALLEANEPVKAEGVLWAEAASEEQKTFIAESPSQEHGQANDDLDNKPLLDRPLTGELPEAENKPLLTRVATGEHADPLPRPSSNGHVTLKLSEARTKVPPPPPEHNGFSLEKPSHANGHEEETTLAFCERLFGASKTRMDLALSALTSFGVENPNSDMAPWAERDWLDFEKSTNKVIRAKVQTELAISAPKADRYEALRRQAEDAEVALRAEMTKPSKKRVQGLARAYEASVGKH